VPPYAACSLIAPVEVLEQDVDKAADAYEEVAKTLIKALGKAGDVVNEVVPLIALAEGVIVSTGSPYSRVSKGGVVWPIFDGLPTKKGSYGELCQRAGEDITEPIELVLPEGVDEFVGDTLGALIGELTGTFSSYFCGDDGEGGTPERPEKKKRREQVAHPPGRDPDAPMRSCVSEDPGAHPDEASGRCRTAECRRCAAMGCEFCLRAMRKGGDYVRGVWTVVENEWVEWTEPDGAGGWRTVRVAAVGDRRDRWSRRTLEGNPCLHPDNPNPGRYDHLACVGYERRWGWDPAASDPDLVPEKSEYWPRPICERRRETEVTGAERDRYLALGGGAGWGDADAPETVRVRQTLFVALTSCVVMETVEIGTDEDPLVAPGEDTSDMRPRVLDPERFPDEAQMTSILWGKGAAGRRSRRVGAAVDAAGGGVGSSRFGFAAAEYYSMDEDEEAMWHMRWLSRLKRFRLDRSGGQGASGEEQAANNAEGMEMTEAAIDAIGGSLGGGLDVEDYLLH
jgi:hypothetical protein